MHSFLFVVDKRSGNINRNRCVVFNQDTGKQSHAYEAKLFHKPLGCRRVSCGIRKCFHRVGQKGGHIYTVYID